ncbi:ABC transporter permease [Negadavirga shengliensis]|uniref:ABC transporter permease n=1 Tax=Negadavirga shengliensis TaxID=1389218 RepID=A0ABV9T901_9BACT
MWKNYFKIAWRNILKNKVRTAIHILGLAIGIAVCFVVFNVISYSYSFDTFHPRKDDIFRVTTTTRYWDQSWVNTGVPFPLSEVIAEELTGIEDITHFYTLYGTMVLVPSQEMNMGRTDKVTFADPGFFRIFQREWLAGNPEIALEHPHSVVLTESSLAKYFPDSDAGEVLGKEILYVYRDSIAVRVTGVVRDYSERTDFTFTDFISKSTLATLESKDSFNMDNWQSVNSASQLFLLLEDKRPKGDMAVGLAHIVEKYIEFEEGRSTEFFIQPLSELHFGSTYSNTGANKTFLKGILIIGMIILLIACMNFINLETAQAINRSKEVGIRKTLGSNKKQLVTQFLVETFVLIWIAIVCSLLMCELIEHYFEDYLPKEMAVNYLSLENMCFLVVLSLFLTFVPGFYPAAILGNYQPVRAMKQENVVVRGGFGIFLRKNLTVLQFTLSIAFIISVLVIHRQIQFLSNQELGFNREVVLYAQTPYKDPMKRNLNLKAQLEQQAFVKAVSLSNETIAASGLWTSSIEYGGENEKQEYEAQIKLIDKDYLEVNGVRLLAGRNIRDVSGETLVNLALVEKLGFKNPDEIIGEILDYDEDRLTVVGVTSNFHARPLREHIRPLIMYYDPELLPIVNVKLEPGTDVAEAKATLGALLKRNYPDESNEFAFLDTVIERFYNEDRKLQGIFGFASGMAVLISCMGLFGLSSFTISRRIKELSIRKVLGASVTQILQLVSREYMALMAVAFLLGSIPAWLFLDNWLLSFSFKIDMPWGLFVLAGLVALTLCLLIVGLHSLKAARKNPAEILKNE